MTEEDPVALGSAVLIADMAIGPVILATGVTPPLERDVAAAISHALAPENGGRPPRGLWLLLDVCPPVSHEAIRVRTTYGAG